MRQSLSSGGVPMEPAFRRPRATKPELFLLCDISGSMAEFAEFTLTFLHAMSEELTRLRSFAFVDGIDEITELFAPGEPRLHVRNVLYRADVVAGDGHSDYGRVLSAFWDRYGGHSLTARSTVIVAGDARGNYRHAGADVLARIHRRVRAVYWLNPEPRAEWNTLDSLVDIFAPSCERTFEVRNLRQLERAVTEIV